MSLKFHFTKDDPAKIKCDAFVILCAKKGGESKANGTLLKTDGGLQIDKALKGLVSQIIEDEGFKGDLGSYKVIYTGGHIEAKKIVLIGMGVEKELNLDAIRKLGAKTAFIANELKAKTIAGVAQPEPVKGLKTSKRLQALFEGMVLGSYSYDSYKDKKDLEEKSLKEIRIVSRGSNKESEKAISDGIAVAEAINYAKDLVNMPADEMTPEALASEASKIAKGKGIALKVLNEAELKKERMNLILAVSKGSLNPPRLIHLTYKPAGKSKKSVAIIGKGITFDSGGYNLKSKHIETMKGDMAGAAMVLAVMKLVAVFKPKINIDAYIPAAENMIDGNAHKPGDIIKSRSGKTVELENMDCEGRLLLADAIDYALQKKPDEIIDAATLTGHVLYGLGEIYTAILGNDRKLIEKIIAISKDVGEKTWQLPLEKEYLKGFKEGIADLTNTGKTMAGTIGGALFIGEFVGKTKWAHLDIATTGWSKEEKDYKQKGGTGAGIQTVYRYLMEN